MADKKYLTGNQFWKVSSKVGADRIFASPEILWEEAVKYFQWVDDHPLYEVDFKGKNAKEVALPRMQPYTIQGLCLYLGVNTIYFNNFETSLIGRQDETSVEFSKTLTRIKDTIYQQKFSGASSGFFKENIISRDLGLADSKRVENSGQINLTVPKEDLDIGT